MRSWGVVLLAAVAVTGCEHVQRTAREHHRIARANDPVRLQREADMNSRWANRPFSELLGTLGAPAVVMSIPAGGNPPGFAIIYGVDPQSGCLDAFAVNVEGSPKVRVYYCR